MCLTWFELKGFMVGLITIIAVVCQKLYGYYSKTEPIEIKPLYWPSKSNLHYPLGNVWLALAETLMTFLSSESHL